MHANTLRSVQSTQKQKFVHMFIIVTVFNGLNNLFRIWKHTCDSSPCNLSARVISTLFVKYRASRIFLDFLELWLVRVTPVGTRLRQLKMIEITVIIHFDESGRYFVYACVHACLRRNFRLTSKIFETFKKSTRFQGWSTHRTLFESSETICLASFFIFNSDVSRKA